MSEKAPNPEDAIKSFGQITLNPDGTIAKVEPEEAKVEEKPKASVKQTNAIPKSTVKSTATQSDENRSKKKSPIEELSSIGGKVEAIFHKQGLLDSDNYEDALSYVSAMEKSTLQEKLREVLLGELPLKEVEDKKVRTHFKRLLKQHKKEKKESVAQGKEKEAIEFRKSVKTIEDLVKVLRLEEASDNYIKEVERVYLNPDDINRITEKKDRDVLDRLVWGEEKKSEPYDRSDFVEATRPNNMGYKPVKKLKFKPEAKPKESEKIPDVPEQAKEPKKESDLVQKVEDPVVKENKPAIREKGKTVRVGEDKDEILARLKAKGLPVKENLIAGDDDAEIIERLKQRGYPLAEDEAKPEPVLPPPLPAKVRAKRWGEIKNVVLEGETVPGSSARGENWGKRGHESVETTDPVLKPILDKLRTTKETTLERSEEEKIWEEEAKDALEQLDSAREFYAEAQNRSREESKPKGFFDIKSRWSNFKRNVFGTKPEPTLEWTDAKKKYETARKRYENAIANLHWVEEQHTNGPIGKPFNSPNLDQVKFARNNNVEIPQVANERYFKMMGKISKELMDKVAIPEFQLLKSLEVEDAPAQEKSMIKKVFDKYRQLNTSQRIACNIALSLPIGLLVGFGSSFFGASALAVGGVYASTRAFRALGGGVGAVAFGGAYKVTLGKLFSGIIEKSRERSIKNLDGSYSLFADTSKLETIEEEAERKRLWNAIGRAMAMAIGGMAGSSLANNLMSGDLLSSAKLRSDPVSKPKVEVAPDVSKPKFQTNQPVGLKEIPKIPPTPAEVPEEIAKSFVDRIQDTFKAHHLVRGDSGELSLKHLLTKNAKQLGWDPSMGSKAKWALGETVKYCEGTPEGRAIRNAITHNGDSLIVEKTGTSWTAHIAKK